MIAVCAIGRADAPDDVVSRTPLDVKRPKTGLSTPADAVCIHRNPGACRQVDMNGAARSGQASPLKNATVIRARSRSLTASVPVSVMTSRAGAAARKRSAKRSQATSVQNRTRPSPVWGTGGLRT